MMATIEKFHCTPKHLSIISQFKSVDTHLLCTSHISVSLERNRSVQCLVECSN